MILFVSLIQFCMIFSPSASLCTGSQLQCSDQCEEVVCAAPQMSQDQVLESNDTTNYHAQTGSSLSADVGGCERLKCPSPYEYNYACINVRVSGMFPSTYHQG